MAPRKSKKQLAEEQEREREYTRRWTIVNALAALEVETERTGPLSTLITPASAQAVIDVCRRHAMTSWDFRHLDEKPGYYGYKVEGREWHWKLRQVRNSYYDELAAAFADADPEEV